MALEDGWRPDPYGRHDERFFFFGDATSRVRDAGVESVDAPPRARLLANGALAPGLLLEARASSAPAGQSKGAVDAAPSVRTRSVSPPKPVRSSPTLTSGSEVSRARPTPRVDPGHERPDGAAPRPWLRLSSKAWWNPPRPWLGMSNKARWAAPRPWLQLSSQARWRLVGAVAVAVAIVAALIGVALLPSRASSRTSTGATSPPNSTPSSSTPAGASAGADQTSTTTTSTTPPVPSGPKATAEQAATTLVATWGGGNQAAALTVATPTAVATLFANRYQPGLATDRGCNSASPATCSFGPPGGASPNDPLFSFTVSQAPAGWYVSAVQVEG